MKPIDLFIFDLDGTLADTARDLVESVNHTLNALAFPGLEAETIIGYVGDGTEALMLRSLGPERQERVREALTIFSAHHEEHLLDHTVLYPGVFSCLEHFRLKKKVVLSNKNQTFTERIVRALGIEDCFLKVMGGDAMPFMKPDARLLPPLLQTFAARPERTVIVGDGRNDILLAKNAGILSCACLRGLTKREILLDLQPDFACENLAELPNLFC